MEHVYYIFAFLIVVFSLLYYHLTSTYGYWKERLIPCLEGALPGLGNVYPMLFLKKNVAEMYRDMYNQMPEHSMIGFYDLRQPSLVVRDPELIKTVLTKNFQNFAKNGLQIDKKLDPLLAVNPFFNDGDSWRTYRQHMNAGFTSGRLKYIHKSVNDACFKLKEYLKKLIKSNNAKVELELKDLFSEYTSEVVASAAFSVQGGSFKTDKDGPFRGIGRMLFEPSLFKGFAHTLILFIPILSKIFRMRFIPLKADRFFRKVTQDALKHREEQGMERPDFLQLMMQYKKAGVVDHDSNQKFNDDDIASHATAFFVDGYETSSITMSFLSYLLAAHPEVQDRVREEVTSVVAKHGGLTYEAIKEMKYMDQALDESMRLFPALALMLKVCTKETELVGSDGLTCKVTPGMQIAIPLSALHRDPAHWPDPEKFDPERFSEENKQKRHKFVYLPWGEGPRFCPGMRMAVLQIKAGVAALIQSFTLEVSPRTKEPIRLDPNHFMSSPIGGLWVNVKSL